MCALANLSPCLKIRLLANDKITCILTTFFFFVSKVEFALDQPLPPAGYTDPRPIQSAEDDLLPGNGKISMGTSFLFVYTWLYVLAIVALWAYFFFYSYQHGVSRPWGFGIVIVGVLVT